MPKQTIIGNKRVTSKPRKEAKTIEISNWELTYLKLVENKMATDRKEETMSKRAHQTNNLANHTPETSYYFNPETLPTVRRRAREIRKSIRNKEILDEEKKGRFGWTQINSVSIPHLYRGLEEYCAVRMVENQLLRRYLIYLPREITTLILVPSYFISQQEADLLNEINKTHCAAQFGKNPFTPQDLVVKLQDVQSFHSFLRTCFKKLVNKHHYHSKYCGFLRVDGQGIVPYTVKDTIKYIPLFYFHDETEILKKQTIVISNWELAYLKFCCKIQGIRKELLDTYTCYVVSLEVVRQHLPNKTLFEEWWPQRTSEVIKLSSTSHPPIKYLSLLPPYWSNGYTLDWQSTDTSDHDPILRNNPNSEEAPVHKQTNRINQNQSIANGVKTKNPTSNRDWCWQLANTLVRLPSPNRSRNQRVINETDTNGPTTANDFEVIVLD